MSYSTGCSATPAHFIQKLPPLLRKYMYRYMPDVEEITNLLIMPQYFELEIYTASCQEKIWVWEGEAKFYIELFRIPLSSFNSLSDALLFLIQEIVDKHSEKNVLDTCSQTLD